MCFSRAAPVFTGGCPFLYPVDLIYVSFLSAIAPPRLNDKAQPLAAGQSVADLLAAQDVNPQGVAVALNGAVLPRGRWAETRLNDG
ncbi:MAG: sulfur carrier protein ThiS, partial [Morganella morganii]